jgi:FixJ family two-component response regulator
VTRPSVLVVDDDPSVRKSFARLIGSAGYEVETFASARDFLARPPTAGPCCVVLDVRMPGMNGIDLQAALAESGRRTSIVFVSGHVDVPASVRAMKNGAVDVLTKPVDEKDLLEAIQRAVDRDDQARADEAQVAEVRERVATLTPREAEVLALVVVGKLNKQIGSELGMGEKTVKVHRARVMRKMRADSLADLVRLADRAGVVPPRREA